MPTTSEMAGLQVSVDKVLRMLRQLRIDCRVSVSAAVYCAAVAEYLIAEVLEPSGYRARARGRLILPRNMDSAIAEDIELRQLFLQVLPVTLSCGRFPGIRIGILPTSHRQGVVEEGRAALFRPFQTYSYRVLKQVHPEVGISHMAQVYLDTFVNEIVLRLGEMALAITHRRNGSVVTPEDLQGAVLSLIDRELGKYAVSEGTKAVTKFLQSHRL